jgi:hypothetical protein
MDMYTFGIVLFELVHGVRPAEARSPARDTSGCRGFDELLSDLLGEAASRPRAVQTATRLGELAVVLGQPPYGQI